MQMSSPRICKHCRTPYYWAYKWNSGNPMWIELDDCECEYEADEPI